MGLNTFEVSDLKPEDKDLLHFGKNGVKAGLCIYSFIDKDTKQHITYAPALDVSGYGDTYEKSIETLKFSIDQYLAYLGSLPSKHRDKELFDLGWKQDWLKNRDFSKAYVDIRGELQNFNADEGTVQRQVLQVA